MSNLEPQTFSVRVLPDAAALVLEVEGEVDMLTAPAVLKAVEEVPEDTPGSSSISRKSASSTRRG